MSKPIFNFYEVTISSTDVDHLMYSATGVKPKIVRHLYVLASSPENAEEQLACFKGIRGVNIEIGQTGSHLVEFGPYDYTKTKLVH